MNLFVFLLLIAMALIIAALFSKITESITINKDHTDKDHTLELFALVVIVFIYGMIFQAFYGPSNPCP